MPTIGPIQRMMLRQPPRFVREGLGAMTGEGFRGMSPRVTHAALPGRTRSEKRANARAASHVLIEYKRITGHPPNV